MNPERLNWRRICLLQHCWRNFTHCDIAPDCASGAGGGASLKGTLSQWLEEAYWNRGIFRVVNERLKRERLSPNAASHVTHLNRWVPLMYVTYPSDASLYWWSRFFIVVFTRPTIQLRLLGPFRYPSRCEIRINHCHLNVRCYFFGLLSFRRDLSNWLLTLRPTQIFELQGHSSIIVDVVREYSKRIMGGRKLASSSKRSNHIPVSRHQSFKCTQAPRVRVHCAFIILFGISCKDRMKINLDLRTKESCSSAPVKQLWNPATSRA